MTSASTMIFVTQAQALPEKFVAPFTLGAPKDTDPSQVVIAADICKGTMGSFIIRGKKFLPLSGIYQGVRNHER